MEIVRTSSWSLSSTVPITTAVVGAHMVYEVFYIVNNVVK